MTVMATVTDTLETDPSNTGADTGVAMRVIKLGDDDYDDGIVTLKQAQARTTSGSR